MWIDELIQTINASLEETQGNKQLLQLLLKLLKKKHRKKMCIPLYLFITFDKTLLSVQTLHLIL